jgi:hypothetical protein
MMIFKNLFEGTPLHNDILEMHGTSGEVMVMEYFYTPYRLLLWNGGNVHVPTVESLALHEISHVIDFYLQDRGRLLMPNFGMKFTKRTAWSRSMVVTETRTVAIQKCLVNTLMAKYKHSVMCQSTDKFYDHFYADEYMTMEEFFDMMGTHMDVYRRLDLLDVFQSALMYLQRNRQNVPTI